MKHFGSIVEFTQARNDDIMRTFRQIIAEVDIIRMPQVCKTIAESPASRFWVSEQRAANVIAALEAGRPMPLMTATKREMFMEIYRRYKLLRTKHPDMSLIALATLIVHQPAPKFYFTPRTIEEFICRIRNGYYDRK